MEMKKGVQTDVLMKFSSRRSFGCPSPSSFFYCIGLFFLHKILVILLYHFLSPVDLLPDFGFPSNYIPSVGFFSQILEKLYGNSHIVIGHELLKLVSVQLSLGDRISAHSNMQRLWEIFELYYGSHTTVIFPYLDGFTREVANLAT